jgi:hypothetical protein
LKTKNKKPRHYRDRFKNRLTEFSQNTLKTVKVSRDGQTLTYRPLGYRRQVTIKVGYFLAYQGRSLIVESIDRETFDLYCTDSDGGDYSIKFDSPDAVNV